MKRKIPMICAALAAVLLPATAAATSTVLSGVFDGSEMAIAGLPNGCGAEGTLKYQVHSPVQVSASGEYYIFDVYNYYDGDVTAMLYNGAFNPNAPLANTVTPNGIDYDDVVNLTAGTNYTLVVQHWCTNSEGAWALTFSGPGSVQSNRAVDVPAYTEGVIGGGEPNLSIGCGNNPYQQSGPVQVSQSGTYYFIDVLENYTYYDPPGEESIDICLHIYSAPVDAANPASNRVASLDFAGTVELEAGRNYYFVVQGWEGTPAGEFLYVLAPPAPFRITHAMAGSWYDPPTSGQGFFIDVFDNLNDMFLAWFTYDLERPDPAVAAMIGDPGHRWMTAYGDFDGGTAELNITWTSGMVFDSPNPPASNESDGTITVEFSDCLSGQVTYDLGSAGVSGQFPIQRLANDALDLCQSLLTGPGQPGPL